MTETFFRPVSGFDLPRFAGVPTFMRLPHVGFDHPRFGEVQIGLIGAPWDGGTTNRPGPRHGPRQLRDLTELRHVVEPAAAEAAARLADHATRARLPVLAARMRDLGEAGRLEEFLELDIELHRLILAASGNDLFAAVGDLVEVVLVGRTELSLMPEKPEAEALDAHEAVAQAIARRDPAAAQAAMAAITAEVLGAFATDH